MKLLEKETCNMVIFGKHNSFGLFCFVFNGKKTIISSLASVEC